MRLAASIHRSLLPQALNLIFPFLIACSRLLEQQAKRPGGMAEYYKRELAASEAVHAAAVAAASASTANGAGATAGAGTAQQAELAARGPKSEAQVAAEASAALGKRIEVNDEGQIIDKRELLTGGLNVKPRQKPLGPQLPGSSAADGQELKGFALSIAERREQAAAAASGAQVDVEQRERERRARKDEASLGMTGMTVAERQRISRERQSRELQRQLLESQEKKRKADEEAQNQSTKRVQTRKNDETKVEEMKRKALERRSQRQKEAAEASRGATAAS